MRPFAATLALTTALMMPTGCALTTHPTTPALTPAAQPIGDLAAFLSSPGPLTHTAAISARWAVPLSGVLDLDHPAVQAAGLTDHDTPIVLPVHLLRHPEAGLFVVDTGIDADRAAGGSGPVRGLVGAFTGSMQPVASLSALVEDQDAPLVGVLLTHLHLDHILGLPDVPAGTAIYAGAGETRARSAEHAMLRRTMSAALDGHGPLQTWDPARAVAFGPTLTGWDVVGDGSLWALATPGHTPGSTAYLARTTSGPVLFTGDTCHTRWGWEHGVPPGSYTTDPAANAASLAALRELSVLAPSLKVYVGHELDGEGTGVEAPSAG